MKSRLLRILETVLFLVLVGSLLFFVPLQKIVEALRETSPSYFWLACLLGLPSIYLGGVQLWMLIRQQEIRVSTLKLFEINLVVKFYSFFSPASMIGSLMRWYKLSGDGKSTEALTAVAVNRLFDVFIAMIFGLFWVIGGINKGLSIQPETFLIFILAVLLLWLLATRYIPPFLNWLQERTKDNPRGLAQKISPFLERLSSSLRVYSSLSAYELTLLVIVGLSSEIFGLLAYVFLALSIHIPVSFVNLGWMRSIFFLASLAPFTLAGGVGLREVSVVLVLSAFGVNADLAAAFSFLIYVRSVILSLIGGVIELISLIISKWNP